MRVAAHIFHAFDVLRATSAFLVIVSVVTAACNDEPQLRATPCADDCWGSSPSSKLDAGVVVIDGALPSIDAKANDGGAPSDGSTATNPDSAVRGDAGSTIDAGSPRDAGSTRDAGSPRDAGFGPVAPGTYAFTPVTTAATSSQMALTHVAIAPDGASMIVSERYDRLHVIALPTEAPMTTVTLPHASGAAVQIAGIRYVAGGIVVAATSYTGAQSSGVVYRLDANGMSPVAVGPPIPGVIFESLDAHPTVSGWIQIIGQTSDGGWVRVYGFDPNASGPVLEGQASNAVGCQDLAPVRDGSGASVSVYACGWSGGAVGVFDGTAFVDGPSISNTSRVASRPQRDYALFVNWSTGRLARYEAGQFVVGTAAPNLGSFDLWDIAFSDDGRRALITGELVQDTLQLREYRHDAYDTASIVDVSIPAFDQSPWFGINGVVLLEAAWRPGTDCGYIVGGCSAAGCARSYLIAFRATNGRACPAR